MGMGEEAAAPRRKQERKTLDQTLKSHAELPLICVNSRARTLWYREFMPLRMGLWQLKKSVISKEHNWPRQNWITQNGDEDQKHKQQTVPQEKWTPALKSFSVGNKKSHWAEDKSSDNVTWTQERWSGWTMMSSGDVDSIADGDWNTEGRINTSAKSSHCHQPDQQVNFTHGQHLLQNQQHHLRLTHPALE